MKNYHKRAPDGQVGRQILRGAREKEPEQVVLGMQHGDINKQAETRF